jgi:hypothetical protein
MINLVDGEIKKEIILIKMVFYKVTMNNNIVEVKAMNKMIIKVILTIKLLINSNKCLLTNNKESLEKKIQTNKIKLLIKILKQILILKNKLKSMFRS